MKEMIFRGKRLDNKKWIEGYLQKIGDKTYICNRRISSQIIEIIPDTLGQHTGLYDKNYKRIFDGDIIKFRHGIRAKIIFNRGRLYAVDENDFAYYSFPVLGNTSLVLVEIIGNVYDKDVPVKTILISMSLKHSINFFEGFKKIDIREEICEPPFRAIVCCLEQKDPQRKHPFEGKAIGEFLCNEVVPFSELSFDERWGIEENEKIYIPHNESTKGFACSYIVDSLLYDEPKKLKEYGIKEPPQSWQYLEK